MSSIQKGSYALAHKDYYEVLDRYTADEEVLLKPLKQVLAPGWEVVRKGPWFHCVRAMNHPPQGWKIHISATINNAREVLLAAAPVLMDEETNFKFAVDRRMVALLNSKGWPRGGSGKFITIYPGDEDQFKRLLARLHPVTAEFPGPYILSDKRYRDSRVLYYRYGGMTPTEQLSVKGDKIATVHAPDGTAVPDERMPYFTPPAWTADPFLDEGEPHDEQSGLTLRQGRYVVLNSLAFSNTGGVYLATDTVTGSEVVIKEARPFVNVAPSGVDAADLLEKEYRILQTLEHTGFAPRPLDFFKDWEHSFMVEEYVTGVSLRLYSSMFDLVLHTRPGREHVESFWESFKALTRRLCEMLEVIHSHGIILVDFTPNNILVIDKIPNLALIDFEAAHEIGRDRPSQLFTHGYAPAEYMQNAQPRFETDYYALGSVLMAYLMPINVMLGMDPRAHERFLESMAADFGLPGGIKAAITGLMQPDARQRLTPRRALEILESSNEPVGYGNWGTPNPDPAEYKRVVSRTLEYLRRVASYDRSDRLFPADPKVFVTNPLNVAFGACGVAYAMKTIGGSVPAEIVDWILKRRVHPQQYQPGFYLGLSGIATVLLELGYVEEAKKLLRLTYNHPLLHNCPDLFYGAAGWGMAQLKFFLETEDEYYLDKAREAGEHLLAARQESEEGCYWTSLDEVYLGLGHGASGISLFLLYLYLATRDEKFLETGEKALDFDIRSGVTNKDGGLTWTLRKNVPGTVIPYFRYGSSGVGTAVLRYHRLTGEERYMQVLENIFLDTDRKYAIFPGKFMGLSGIGEFLLDMADAFPRDPRFLEAAHKIASGVLLFQIDRDGATAFPGYELLRITCDYATGCAGIALFLDRLTARRPADFLLDELFVNAGADSRREHACAFAAEAAD